MLEIVHHSITRSARTTPTQISAGQALIARRKVRRRVIPTPYPGSYASVCTPDWAGAVNQTTLNLVTYSHCGRHHRPAASGRRPDSSVRVSMRLSDATQRRRGAPVQVRTVWPIPELRRSSAAETVVRTTVGRRRFMSLHRVLICKNRAPDHLVGARKGHRARSSATKCR